jgi:hypothetical protein
LGLLRRDLGKEKQTDQDLIRRKMKNLKADGYGMA